MTIYIVDLKNLNDYLLNSFLKENGLIYECFCHQNNIYNITIKSLEHPTKRLIFKDYYRLVPFHDDNIKISVKIETLLLFKLLGLSFGVDLDKPRINTYASVAMNIFSKLSPNKKKLIKRLNMEENKFIQKAYFGGRDEIFRPYNNTSSYFYDVNSLYPYIMQNYPLPIGEPKKVTVKEYNIKDFYGFIDVDVIAPDMRFPVLPFQPDKSLEGIKMYPTGEFRGVFFSEELKLALEYGYKIKKIYSAYSFESSIIFEDFVNSLYQIRIETPNKDLSKITKLLLNSIHGKFGSVFLVEKQNDIINEIGTTEHRNNVSISAAICSLARIKLYSYMQKYYKHILYVDTDALILTKPMDIEDIDDKAIGKFKLIAEIKEFAAVATKFYYYITIDDKFVPVFRGISMQLYSYNSEYIRNNFKKYRQKLLIKNNSRTSTIQLELMCKENNMIEISTQEFTHKRAYFLDEKNRYIDTRPWIVNPKYF